MQEDFAYLKDQTISRLADRKKMEEMQSVLHRLSDRLARDPEHVQRHEEKMREMGVWLGKYFDDAGYQAWAYYPELFKAMVMTAFPPIEDLDATAGSSVGSLRSLEEQQINFLSVMDRHLTTSRGGGVVGAAYFKETVA